MSGGVDSSVSAHLLAEAGWEVLGITMKIPVSCGTGARPFCGADAARVCGRMGIPHYFVDVTGTFEKHIIEPFRTSYAKGLTPNPCVDCNGLIKFSLVWDAIRERFSIEHLATGHYAQVITTNGQTRLCRARDTGKDQSYFLYRIGKAKLPSLVFPLGALTKRRVRSKAEELKLPVSAKPASMELCFADQDDYRSVLSSSEADRCGDITDMQGNKIGVHNGIANYTLGQRRGVGFAGGVPLYVGKIDARANTIALGTREQISLTVIRANKINVLIPEELVPGRQCFGKIRSYGEPRLCKIVEADDTDMTVEFEEPQFAPCPGQSLVLYNSDDCIVAGGKITAMS